MTDILHPLITHQEIGTSFVGTYYIEAAFVKSGKNKKDFTELTLRDKSGSRVCRYWGLIAGAKKGCFVYVEATVEYYMGAPSIVVNRIEIKDAPSDTSNYIAVCDDLDKHVSTILKVREWLKQTEASCSGSVVGKVVDDVYSDDFYKRFLTTPGSVKPFYGRQGGLLANTARVVEQCSNISGSYSLRPDEKLILTAAALLFRVGAIDVYEFRDCMPAETDKGVLLGMNNMTMNKLFISVRKVLAEETKANRAIDSDGVFRLMHAASAYTNSHLLRPMTKEAIILAAAYRMDNELVEAIEFMANDTNTSEKFTAYDPAFGRRYYVGKRQ